MFTTSVRSRVCIFLITVFLIFTVNHLAEAAKPGGRSSGPEGILRVDEVVCDVGQVANRITNSTVEKVTGENNYCILMGDDSAELPSMVRHNQRFTLITTTYIMLHCAWRTTAH